VPAAALAQYDNYESDMGTAYEGATESWEASFRLGVVVAPDFEGSDTYKVLPFPMIDFHYGPFFISTARGLGFIVFDNGMFTVAPTLNYVMGREESDNDLLTGMGDVSGGFTAGGLLAFRSGPVAILGGLNFGLGNLKGSTFDLGAYYTAGFTERLTATFGIGTQYATSARTKARFGVTPLQSERSGYQVYNPGGGLKHLSLSGNFTFDLTQSVDIGLFGEYRVLTGPAESSPLVKAGSANQAIGGLTLGFKIK
jgi:outer membrane scaffolding protein for murein synthesis (MipA/OmpV family)